MGALIVLLFLGLIGGIIYKIKNRAALPTGTGLVDSACLPTPKCARQFSPATSLTINTGTEVFIVEVSTRKVLLGPGNPDPSLGTWPAAGLTEDSLVGRGFFAEIGEDQSPLHAEGG